LCLSARVVYLASGLDPAGIDLANTFGEAVYDELQRLPASLSTKAKRFDPELRSNIEALRSSREWYRVYGGLGGEGAVIVSQLDEPVEFHRALSGRVANVVPVDDPADVLPRISAATQTIGIYPDSLKAELRDVLALHGAQRLTSLGYAADPHLATPQDGIEPLRRMTKWIVDESCDPATTPALWEQSSVAGGHRDAIAMGASS
jgi:hypothetical protein